MLSTLQAHQKTNRLLAKPWEKPDLADTFADASNKNTLSRGEAEAMAAHRDKYTAAMRTQRTAREYQKKNGRVRRASNAGQEKRVSLARSCRWAHNPHPLTRSTLRICVGDVQVAEDDVNLGMDTRSGLAAPEPKLSRTVDPLWRVDSTKEAAPRMLRQLGPADLEGTHQWKARPQSEQERIDVSCAGTAFWTLMILQHLYA